MILPPFVIINGAQSDLSAKPPSLVFLAPHGWQRDRRQALSFASGDEGERWIAEGRKTTPRLFATADAKVIKLVAPRSELSGGVKLQGDYDPFAYDVVA